MIQSIESGAEVIAIKITGKLMREELLALADRLERSFEANERTHVFVEIEDYHGFDLAVLPEYLPRAFRMLRELDRFGRIAVVSDLAWIRWATRLESALLPGISYEVFTADERDQALAWVEGRSALPHHAALTFIETDRPDVFGFALDGKIGAEEMHRLVARIGELMDRQPGPVRVLGRITHFRFPELGGLDGDYVRMKLEALERVDRYALVGGPVWMTAWAAALDPLLKAELRHFPADREAEAWAWLGARPSEETKRAA